MNGVLKFNFPVKIAILGFSIFKALLKEYLLLDISFSELIAEILISKSLLKSIFSEIRNDWK